MERSAMLFVNAGVLAAAASLGSYYIYQWFASYGWRSALPWFASGLAFAVIVASVGLTIFETLPLPKVGKTEIPDALFVGSPDHSYGRRSHPSSDSDRTRPQTPVLDQHRIHRGYVDGSRETTAGEAARTSPTRSAIDDGSSGTQPSAKESVPHQGWLEDLSFWGATRCVLAIRLDPEDLTTWMLINDCGADVRILVATCASEMEECLQRRTVRWSYVPNGIVLPAKVKRSVALDEQTVRGLHLRYVACRSNVAVDQTPRDDQDGALRHVGVQSCDEEVRSLSRVGEQSGWSIEDLVNEPIPANPCCNKSE